MASIASSAWLVTTTCACIARSRARSAKHSPAYGQRWAPRHSRACTDTCAHALSVCGGAASRSPVPDRFGLLARPTRAAAPPRRRVLPLGHLDQRAGVVRRALADPVQAGVVGAALEHGVRPGEPRTGRSSRAPRRTATRPAGRARPAGAAAPASRWPPPPARRAAGPAPGSPATCRCRCRPARAGARRSRSAVATASAISTWPGRSVPAERRDRRVQHPAYGIVGTVGLGTGSR